MLLAGCQNKLRALVSPAAPDTVRPGWQGKCVAGSTLDHSHWPHECLSLPCLLGEQWVGREETPISQAKTCFGGITLGRQQVMVPSACHSCGRSDGVPGSLLQPGLALATVGIDKCPSQVKIRFSLTAFHTALFS